MEDLIVLKNNIIKKFVTGGHSEFTVRSLRTDKHLIFKVNNTKKEQKKYFVSIDTHYGNYMCIGIMYTNPNKTNFTFVKSSRLKGGKDASVSVLVFNYIVKHYLNSQNHCEEMIFYHHGKCAICGRKLTTPESIEIGIGPSCLKRI